MEQKPKKSWLDLIEDITRSIILVKEEFELQDSTRQKLAENVKLEFQDPTEKIVESKKSLLNAELPVFDEKPDLKNCNEDQFYFVKGTDRFFFHACGWKTLK